MFMPPEFSLQMTPQAAVGLLAFFPIAAVLVISVDLMRRALDWVSDQEENIRTLIESSPNGILVVDDEGRITTVNQTAAKLFGYERSELLGQPIEMLVPIDKATEHVRDRLDFMRRPAVRAMGKGRDLRGRSKDDSQFPIEVGLTPVRQKGKNGVLATVIDISERKAAEDQQRFLLKELAHRSQNLFAVIQSIAARSFGTTANISEAQEAFEARLLALARTHEMLGEAAWRGAPLTEIITKELAAFEDNVNLSGCDIFVNPSAAQQFALIFHELATNATKYGALSAAKGKIAIDGKLERANGEEILTITWKESGGPPVQTPRRKGFGTTILIEAARAFGNDAKLDFNASGLAYEFRIPLNSIEVRRANAIAKEEAP
jgi:PAS domain S-box-containing protein